MTKKTDMTDDSWDDDDYFASDFTRHKTLDMLAKGGLFASLSGLMAGLPQQAYAQTDEVVRIGYVSLRSPGSRRTSLRQYSKGVIRQI